MPAYFANGSPVLVGGGRPIDGGRCWRDGRRIFGDGKTIRGFFGGVIIGTAIGFFQYIVEAWDGVILRAFLLSFGALLGDLIGSFIKRRLNIERGQPALGMDQLGFMVAGVILIFLTLPLTLGSMNFILNLPILGNIVVRYTEENFLAYIIILFPLTFFAHITANLLVRQTI
jgi:CDP-2,3-bis-(O-geranylgeranyl)-sn-glycerol synthase